MTMFLEIWELLKITSDLHIDKNVNDSECHILFGLMHLKGRKFAGFPFRGWPKGFFSRIPEFNFADQWFSKISREFNFAAHQILKENFKFFLINLCSTFPFDIKRLYWNRALFFLIISNLRVIKSEFIKLKW